MRPASVFTGPLRQPFQLAPHGAQDHQYTVAHRTTSGVGGQGRSFDLLAECHPTSLKWLTILLRVADSAFEATGEQKVRSIANPARAPAGYEGPQARVQSAEPDAVPLRMRVKGLLLAQTSHSDHAVCLNASGNCL